jgi:hypothetical protein
MDKLPLFNALLFTNVTLHSEFLMYEGQSVNGSQMDMKRKTYDIQTRKISKNNSFSTYPPLTLIHLSQGFNSSSKPAA